MPEVPPPETLVPELELLRARADSFPPELRRVAMSIIGQCFLYRAAGDVVGNVTPKIHEHMRRLGRSPGQPSGWSSFWPGFVVPPSTDPSQVVDPYPVGFEPPPPSPETVARRQSAQRAATFLADPFASEASRSLENVYALWGSESWAQIRWRPPLPPRRLRNLEPKPKEGVNKAAVAAGAIAGVALGELLARTGK